MPLIAPTTIYIVTFSLLIWALIIARFITLYRRSQFRRQHKSKAPPIAEQSPLLYGFDIPFKFVRWLRTGVFLQGTHRLALRSGRTFSLRILGENTVWTTSPSNIQAILSTQFSNFELSQSRINAFKPYTGDGIFSSNGTTWSHARAIVRPSLSKVHVQNLDIYERHFCNLSALIPRNGETVDLQELFSRMTIDTASDFLFGESVHALDPQQSSTSKAVSDAFNYTSKALAFRLHMGAITFLFPDKKFKKSVNLIHEYVDYFVDKAMAYRASDEKEIEGKAGKYVYLRELANDTGDRKVLRDQIVSILAAGRDTTAALLSLSFWLLLRHPRVVQCLREEIAHICVGFLMKVSVKIHWVNRSLENVS
jgi:cytochrome P450